MRGGEEREEATELYRLSASICEQIYTSQSLRYARILKEFAEHLESRHQEKGRPENSRWNKSFAIPEDDLSSEARFFYNTSLQTYTEIVSISLFMPCRAKISLWRQRKFSWAYLVSSNQEMRSSQIIENKIRVAMMYTQTS
jgi:hypothetical protein